MAGVLSMSDAAGDGICPYAHLGDALAEGTLLDRRIQASPNWFYRELRNRDPVHYDEQLGMYLVSRFEDLQTVVQDPITYSSERGYREQYAKGFHEEFQKILAEEGGGYFPDAIKTDPPYHTRIRRLIDKAFTAHRVKELEPKIVEVVREVVAAVAPSGEADGISDIAAPVTIKFICEQLGLGDVDGRKIQDWSYAVVAQMGQMQTREQMIANARLICELQLFLIDHIRDRQARPRDDIITDLIQARDDEDGGALTFEEIVSLVRAFLIAGNETTATAIGHLLVLLATQPHVAEELHARADDEKYMNRFVEELLRWEPPSRGLTRMTTREVELGGKTLPEGSHLMLLWASGNDTEAVFPQPRAFDLTRDNLGRHLSFGAGPHRCVGAALARMEIKVTARETIRRLTDIRLRIPVEEIRFVPTVATHPLAELPLSFRARI
jgi:cytochrome P450